MTQPVARALLASAALAAAIALAGCDTDGIVPTGRAAAPLSDKTQALISEKNMDKESPILIRLFKEEAEMEMWKKNRDGQYALLKTYPICRWSGDLGPKKKEGDRQAPEGFYTITPAHMNPNSNYYLAFNTGYPNAFDRAWGRSGSELMVHGDCSSRGCYAMTDEQMQEIYALARESFFGGQKDFQLEAFPFRMTALNMAKHRNNENFAFWKMLKEGYDNFEATRQEPRVAVCDKRYVFDAVAKDGKSPLHSNPRGACPAHQLDPAIADAVLDYRRQEQVKMANYIGIHVATVAPHVGDGGMNPVFAKLTNAETDNAGRYVLASATQGPAGQVPGALPHVPNPPGTTIPKVGKPAATAVAAATPASQPAPASEPAPVRQPVVMASVRIPEPAPLAKEGQAPLPEETKPATIASLFDNLFRKEQPQTAPAPIQPTTTPAQVTPPPMQATPAPPARRETAVALRGASGENTDTAAKPKSVEPRRAEPKSAEPKYAEPQRTAAAAPIVLHPKPQKPAPHKPAAVARTEPVAMPAAKVAAAKEKAAPARAHAPAPEREIRTADSGVTTGSGLLAGAQPVVPTGSFSSR